MFVVPQRMHQMVDFTLWLVRNEIERNYQSKFSARKRSDIFDTCYYNVIFVTTKINKVFTFFFSDSRFLSIYLLVCLIS